MTGRNAFRLIWSAIWIPGWITMTIVAWKDLQSMDLVLAIWVVVTSAIAGLGILGDDIAAIKEDWQ